MTEREKLEKSLGERIGDRIRDFLDEVAGALEEAFNPPPEPVPIPVRPVPVPPRRR